MKKNFYLIPALCFTASGAIATQGRADVIGTFTAGGFTSPTFIGIMGQNSIGRSRDGAQQRGLLYSYVHSSPVISTSSSPTPTASSVLLATSSASTSAGTVTLTFDGVLDAATATDKNNYHLSGNGGVLTVGEAVLSGNGTTVTLTLAAGAWKAGDTVTANYDLLDAKKRVLKGIAVMTVS